MPRASSISCIIVTFNSRGIIGDCLKSAREQIHDANIFVHDNGSEDGTLALVRSISPDIQCRSSSGNLGFGGAINSVLPAVSTPYILLLNPDAVLKDGAIDAMLSVAEECPDSAIVGAVQETPSQEIVGPQPSQGRFRDVETIYGAAMLIRLSCYPQGEPLFDPRFWMYYEDSDLCRSTRKRGFRVLLAHEARIVHSPGTSSSLASPAKTLAIKRRQYLEYLASGYLFQYKHHGRARTLARSVKWLTVHYGHYLFLLLRRDPSRYPTFQRSLAVLVFYRRLLSINPRSRRS